MQIDDPTKDLPLVSESMAKIAEHADAATAHLKRIGRMEFADMLGLTEFDKHLPVEKDPRKAKPSARFY